MTSILYADKKKQVTSFRCAMNNFQLTAFARASLWPNLSGNVVDQRDIQHIYSGSFTFPSLLLDGAWPI